MNIIEKIAIKFHVVGLIWCILGVLTVFLGLMDTYPFYVELFTAIMSIICLIFLVVLVSNDNLTAYSDPWLKYIIIFLFHFGIFVIIISIGIMLHSAGLLISKGINAEYLLSEWGTFVFYYILPYMTTVIFINFAVDKYFRKRSHS
jgi:hypothetical protein